jgi:neutral ceramidase
MSQKLWAGVARVNVTPSAGHWMAGYPPELGQVDEFPDNIKGFVGRKKPSTGAHDPLWAKALVLDNGDERIAIVSIDTLIVTKVFTDALRAESERRWKIAPRNLLINTTHTHSAPDVFGLHSPRNEVLENQLANGVLGALGAACAGMVEVKIGLGRGRAGEVVINRRDLNAATDQEIAVLRINGPDGLPLAILAKVTCHPVIMDYANLLYSADLCAAMYTTVEAAHPTAISFYLIGCAGNINPARFPYWKRQNIYIDQTAENYPVYWGSFEEAARTGRVLGHEVLRVVEEISMIEPPLRLPGELRNVNVPLKSRTDRQTFIKFLGIPPHFAEPAMRSDTFETDVQALAIGPITLIGLPGEPFVETGMAIKERLGRENVIVLGYSNDDVRYILPAAAYRGDKYETLGTWLSPQAESVLIEAAVNVARNVITDIHTQPVGSNDHV